MENKPGVKTSEFWVAVILSGGTFMSQVMGMDLDTTAFAAVFAPAIAYIAARGMAKWNK